MSGEAHPCVLNIGHRPTLRSASPTLTFEVHLLDFQGDLYGEELEIEFVERLREERRFPSVDVLKAQIAEDIAHARSLPGMRAGTVR